MSVTVFASPEPRAVSGIIDLSHWSFEHDGQIALTGDYEFYWEEFVDPVMSSPTTEVYQAVPGTWNGSQTDSTTFPAHGYASYRLTVRLNQIEPLTLKFFDAATSYRAFVDGQLVASNGSPGVDESATEPGSYPLLTDFVPTRKEFVLVLHVANFDYQKGGAWEKITLGKGDQIRSMVQEKAVLDWVLFGALFIFGIFNIAIAFLQREGFYAFYLGLFCLAVCVRIVSTTERYLIQLVPQLDWEYLITLAYLSFYVAVPLFCLFLFNSFKEDYNRLVLRVIVFVGFGSCLLVVVTPPVIFTYTLIPYQIFSLLGMAYCAYVIYRAIKNKRSGAWLVLMGYVALCPAGINDLLVSNQLIETGYLVHIGTFLLAFFHGFSISFRFTDVYKTIDTQHKSLSATNRMLHEEIAGRLKAEEDKQELYEQLERSRKMESLGVLAGGVAHDLNNILSSTINYPEMILRDLPDDLPDQQKQHKRLEYIRDSGLQAAAVVQDLLALARRGITKQQVTNLNDIVASYIDSPEYYALVSSRGCITMDLDIRSPLPNIVGSPPHINNVIMNLILNSVEAQPDGGRVAVSTYSRQFEEPIVLYEKIEAGNYAVLRIEDEGPGISKEDLGRIFEPFYSLKPMEKSGSGLGMTVVWGVVHDHGGYINIESELGKGSFVECYFPVTEQEIEPVVPQAPVSRKQGSGERILVIDDVLEQRQVARDMLEHMGYSVTLCADGESALRLLRKENYDLIMLDMIMPSGLDGLDTYKEILKIQPEARVVIISGYADTDRVKKALRLGVRQVLRKPYTLNELSELLKSEFQYAI